MHGEVNAEGMPKIKCESFDAGTGQFTAHFPYCKIKDLTCVSARNGLSCVKS
jgi:hypothetical protein